MATIPTTGTSLLPGSSAAALQRGGRATRARPSAARLLLGRRRALPAVRASAKDIAFDQASRSALQAGVEKLANAVGVTLGPRGAIPPSISNLLSLGVLNLSNNHLRGPIPTGSQLQTLVDPSIYGNNPGLCGFPLSSCERELKAMGNSEIQLGCVIL